MTTIADKLILLNSSKNDIHAAIETKGVDVPAALAFSGYAAKILEIPTGGDPDPAIFCPTNGYEIPEDPKIVAIENGYYDADTFVFKILTTTANKSVSFPFANGYGFNHTINYGDGSAASTITAYNSAGATHTYVVAGQYTVKIYGICQGFSCQTISAFRPLITNIVQWGNCDFRLLNFYNCTGLKTIPNSPISGVAEITNFQNLFLGCTALTCSIPGDLFIYATKVAANGFNSTFSNCSGLTGSIPVDLFKYNTLVSTYGFNMTFYYCSGLTSVPSNLFRYNTLVSTYGFNSTFQGCTSVRSIPLDLFKYNTKVTTSGFSQTFFQCTGLSGSIPVDLFRYNTLVSTSGFTGTFYYCQGLTGSIPADLFRYNTQVSSSGFFQTFCYCTGLTGSIPATLFKYNILVSTSGFFGTFSLCTSLTGAVPADLFRYNTLVSTSGFNQTFSACEGLTSLPADLFRYNTAVSTNGFEATFSGCIKLQLNRNIFFADGEESTRFLNKTISFTNCFARTSFTGNPGEAPALWNCDFGTGIATKSSCYSGLGNSLASLSNYASIPPDWIV